MYYEGLTDPEDERVMDKPPPLRNRGFSMSAPRRNFRQMSKSPLRRLSRSFDHLVMTEGRRSQVVLLDDRRLEILIQPKLHAGELLDIVASHFNLKEKEYFGITFLDETGHFHWLQLDRRVLDHDFIKRTGPLTLYFQIKFYVESIAHLRDSASIELFYLQAKSLVSKGTVECDSETAFELAAHVLQATHGDYVDNNGAKANLKKLPVIPTNALKEHPSISYCEERIIHHYKKLDGQRRGQAIVNYMTIIESLPTFGVHYYEVKDKSGLPWWLGLSYKGIGQYDHTDKRTPRKVFQWKQLENLYFRDKKFSIEVHDPKRVSVSRRTFGPGNVNVHAWFAVTPALTKCIWSMAICQHQFYLDRKQSKVHLAPVRSMSEIAADLSLSNQSLSTSSSAASELSPCESSQSLTMTAIPSSGSSEQSEGSKMAQLEMFNALKARKEALEEALKKKTDELKLICLKEWELTGEMPAEIPFAPGEPIPQIRRRVGTTFTLSDKLINRDKNEEMSSRKESTLNSLEMDFEIQSKITSAALKLANDISAKKSVRKQRKTSYQKSFQRLKEIEVKLKDLQTVQQKKNQIINECVERPESLVTSSCIKRDSSNYHLPLPNVSPSSSSQINRPLPPTPTQQQPTEQVKVRSGGSKKAETLEAPSPSVESSSSASHSTSSHSATSWQSQQATPPTSPVRQHPSTSSSRTSSPSPNRPYSMGYTPSSIYQTRTAYRTQQYPTFSTRTTSSGSCHIDNHLNNGGGLIRWLEPNFLIEGAGAYHVASQRTSQTFDSQDDLKTPVAPDFSLPLNNHDPLGLPSKHNSLEGAYKRHNLPPNRYGSLDRTLGTSMYSKNESAQMNIEKLDHSPHRYRGCDRGQQKYATIDGIPRRSKQWFETSLDNDDHLQNSERSVKHYHLKESPQMCIAHEHENHVHIESSQPVKTVKQYQPYREVTKPYELSDYYKYSTKVRKQKAAASSSTSLDSPSSTLSCNSSPSRPHSPYMDLSPQNQTQPSSPYPQPTSPYPQPTSPYPQPTSPYPQPTSPYPQTTSPYPQPTSPYPPATSPYPQATSPYPQATSPYPAVQKEFEPHSYRMFQPSPINYQTVRSCSPFLVAGHGPVYQSPQQVCQTVYQPLQPQTCEPISNTNSSGNKSSLNESFSSKISSRDNSFTFDAGESLAEAFSEEMLAWYEDQESVKQATLV